MRTRALFSGRVVGSVLAAGVLLFGISCSGDSPTESNVLESPEPQVSPSITPTEGPTAWAIGEAGNGPGQCLLDDTQDAGFIQNVTELQCTSEDVDISVADVSFYSINSEDPADFVELPAGETIKCAPNDIIRAVTSAEVLNNANERYDFGMWINPTGSAYDGAAGSCLHFNLVVGDDGVANIDETPDACGDIDNTTEVVSIPLDTLVLQCPAGGETVVSVDACAAWSNSTTGANDRICPVAGAPTVGDGFRRGTTPGTTAKCRCEPLVLPVEVLGVIRVDKVTVPSGETQSFAFTPSGTGFTTPFNLTDASTPHSSGPIEPGTYGVTETVPAGWELTGRACVLTGTSTPADFTTSGANGVSVDLASGQDVTCTFTNTKQASVTIKKVTVPAESPAVGSFTFSQDFDASGTFNLGHNGTKVFTNVSSGTEYTVVESDPTPDYDLTAIVCTGAATYTGTVNTRTLEVTPAAGETIECTFTNTRRGTVIIEKQTDPDGATGSFAFTSTLGNIAALSDGQQHTYNDVAPGGPYGVTETNPSPLFDLYDIDCDDANSTESEATRTASIRVEAGETVTCTFYNRQRATITAEKRENGQLPLTQPFEFQIRTGATGLASGTVVASDFADAATGDIVFACTAAGASVCAMNNGTAYFVPGTYQFCEVNMEAGWANNINGFTPNGEAPEGDDNGNECIDIVLSAGETGNPTEVPNPVDNTPPPGGDARTIGYWKNHSCAAKGNQEDVLSQNLPIQLTEGSVNGDFDWLINSCQTVVYLLDKRTIGGAHKKMASDAAYGLAAQLAAALLNINADAGTCEGDVLPIIDQAQKLLDDINFNGNGNYLRPGHPLYNTAVTLAGKLDAYNNNECSAL